MSEIDDIIRARLVHEEALEEINSKILACRESIRNFAHLSHRLETLPHKMSHEVMVPFGKLAFMPGRLVHTNELLVHLGDAYFASMTCKQSLQIVEMRQNNLQSTLTDLEKVAQNLQAKSQYLDEIKGAAEDKEMEIKEELIGNYLHPKDRTRVSRSSSKSNSNKQIDEKKPSTSKNFQADQHAALMARLDELEKLEEQEDELYKLSEDSDNVDSSHPSDTDDDESYKKEVKHVRFQENVPPSSVDSIPTPCMIRFKHSKEAAKECNEMTPRDVHKLVYVRHNEPRSILKSKETEISAASANTEPGGVQLLENMAVSDVVKEHTSANPKKTYPETAASKPISKFKASRKKR